MYNGEMAQVEHIVICYLWAGLELTADSNILCSAVPNILKKTKLMFIVTFVGVGHQFVQWVSGCQYILCDG